MTSSRFRVIVAGGGIAGLEALFALRALGGEHVELTLLCPKDHFSYRPLAIAKPLALGSPRETPLSEAARDADATFVQASLESVDAERRTVVLGTGETLGYDALLLALGAASTPAFQRAFTWDDATGVEDLGGLMRDLEEGYTRRIAIVVPPGPGWPLPAYELALLIAAEAQDMNMEPDITLVTPEQAPLAIFGSRAVEMVEAELREAGVRLELGVYAEMATAARPTIALRPSGRRLEVDRAIALPRLRGRAPSGVPADPDGFVPVDPHGRVTGTPGIWAAGDGIAFPVKFGGLATEQADAAAADIAAEAGALVERTPFRPVLRGRLLTGRGPRWIRYDAAGGGGEGEVATHALWWPPGKVAGRWLAPWLAERDDEAVAGDLPDVHGLPVQIDLHRERAGAMAGSDG
jgi:sulfide:quinone oxidoreductase